MKFNSERTQESPIFSYHQALSKPIGLLSIPHSGELLPEVFKSYLVADHRALIEDVDMAVDKLVDIKELQKAGVSILISKILRTCVDLNRPRTSALLNWKKNTQGLEIVTSSPENEQAEALLQRYYDPYFHLLENSINFLQQSFKKVTAIDLHSMPSRPTAYHLAINPNQNKWRPEICISDLKGKSCSAEFIESIKTKFKKKNFKATINDPYFGGYITQYMDGFPTNNIQIEINRSLYMDEKKKQLLQSKANHFKEHLTKILISHYKEWSSQS